MKKCLISAAIGLSLVVSAQAPKKAQDAASRQSPKMRQASQQFQESWTSNPMVLNGGGVIASAKNLVVNQKDLGISQEEPRFIAHYLSDIENDAAAFSVHLSGHDVYVAGVERKHGIDPISLEAFTNKATVWKNGELYQYLGENKYNSKANSVFVSNNDVYAVGYETNGKPRNEGTFQWLGPVGQRLFNNEFGLGGLENQSSATVWKNGKVHQYLSDGKRSAEANYIFVSGKDVYVAVEHDAIGYGKALLFKNAKDQSLEGVSSQKASVANSIFVSGSDVYVAGAKRDSQGGVFSFRTPFHAVIWKNGKEYQRLTDGKFNGKALSVFVLGNDVYAAGVENNSREEEFATVWKNGKVLYRLNDIKQGYPSETILEGEAKSIFVSGNDVYVAGLIRSGNPYIHTAYVKTQIPGTLRWTADAKTKSTRYPVAILWKNGQVYSRFGDGKSASEAHSVVVSDDDIYVAGFERRVAMLWKGK